MGEVVESWATAFTMRGSFQVVGSREFPASRKVYAESTGRFLMDYRSELLAARATEQYRIRWNGQIWNLSPPAYDNVGREMTIEVISKIEPE
jgi:head-tail adaptor